MYLYEVAADFFDFEEPEEWPGQSSSKSVLHSRRDVMPACEIL